MAAADFQLDLAIAAFQQTLQFGHALARHDDLALGTAGLGQIGFAQGQAMAVGGDGAQRITAQVEQQAVEVIAHVLLGHRERSALNQLLQGGFADRNTLGGFHFVHRREVVGGQGGQGEAAASCLHGDLVTSLRDGDPAAIGQCADDLEQLAGGNGGFAVLGIFNRDPRHHLHFQVGTGQRQLAVLHLHQEIGQNRKGLAAFDHVDDLCQRLEKGFALQCETHVVPCPYALKKCGINQKLGGAGRARIAGKHS
ncbi:hypothetical protein D3C72_1237680 [compost metagenome]